MPSFQDKKGRTWEIEITKSLADRIKRDFQIDLIDLKALGDGLVRIALTEMETFFAVLWVLCEEQAESLNISPEEWGKAIGSDAMESGLTAIEDAIIRFSPSPTAREAKAKLIRAANRLAANRESELTEDFLLEKMSAAAATNSPHSSVSSQTG